jgi:hypothetical protein
LLLLLVGFLLLFAADAFAMRIGAGAFAGLNLPVAMDDVTSGKIYGLKARLVLLPYVGVEPNLTFSDYGEGEVEVYDETMTRDGGEITSFGVDAVLGGIQGTPGLSVYGLLGIGSAKWSREGIDDVSELSTYIGFGTEYSMPSSISIEVRAKAQVISHEDGTYKNGCVTIGLNYYFGELGGM